MLGYYFGLEKKKINKTSVGAIDVCWCVFIVKSSRNKNWGTAKNPLVEIFFEARIWSFYYYFFFSKKNELVWLSSPSSRFGLSILYRYGCRCDGTWGNCEANRVHLRSIYGCRCDGTWDNCEANRVHLRSIITSHDQSIGNSLDNPVHKA